MSATAQKDALQQETKTGAYNRVQSTFRNGVEKNGQFPPQGGRYHLYVSLACPWACRTLILLYLKGLEDEIGISVTHPTWQFTRPGQDEHTGWTFANTDDKPFVSVGGYGNFPPVDVIPDSVTGAKYVRDLYEKAESNFQGRYTVPVLWDKKNNTIVNNESSEIIRLFNSQFNDISRNPDLDLYPEPLRKQIDEINSWVYPQINNGVYRAGFASSQEAYEDAFKDVFSGLDKVEAILSKNRYLCGDQITEADVRLYVTLIRFDPVYVVYFKCNKKFINQYPNIKGYVQELYNMEAFQKASNIWHIKTHYFTSHQVLNHYAIVPIGPDPWWEEKSPRLHSHS